MGKNLNISTDVFLQYGISEATVRNWEKLSVTPTDRLQSRANKRHSVKRILPLEYFCNKGNILFVNEALDYIDEHDIDIKNFLFSLGISLLKKANLLCKKHVIEVLNEYDYVVIDNIVESLSVPDNEFDLLGVIYQSYLNEGKKNIIGSYYTPASVVNNMTSDISLSSEEIFLDPCCGSGAFLLSINTEFPEQLYGIDNDEIAVMLCKINLLLKYRNHIFIPHVFCFNFLTNNENYQRTLVLNKKFDYIYTNPPWGAMTSLVESIQSVTSKETFSYFFVRAFSLLKKDGIIRFLLPESILNVKVHRDIRRFILEKTRLLGITLYEELFSGVTTKYVDIQCSNNYPKKTFNVKKNSTERIVKISSIYETDNFVFNLLSDEEVSIINLVKNKGKNSLKDSIWALGIVTGDNKRKISPIFLSGMEKIYTGKEIRPYNLIPAKNFIKYDRASFQQVARDEIYRAPEKLVYKFISNKLIFAYDNSSSLFLNSANILIPKLPSMSTKTVLAFLNSELFNFMYKKLFGEVKVLKGNLIELPFPSISEKANEEIMSLVDKVLDGDILTIKKIDDYIFTLYEFSNSQISYIRNVVYGKIDK